LFSQELKQHKSEQQRRGIFSAAEYLRLGVNVHAFATPTDSAFGISDVVAHLTAWWLS
jgi:hypothetical protein